MPQKVQVKDQYVEMRKSVPCLNYRSESDCLWFFQRFHWQKLDSGQTQWQNCHCTMRRGFRHCCDPRCFKSQLRCKISRLTMLLLLLVELREGIDVLGLHCSFPIPLCIPSESSQSTRTQLCFAGLSYQPVPFANRDRLQLPHKLSGLWERTDLMLHIGITQGPICHQTASILST